jgi:hypothetical protein
MKQNRFVAIRSSFYRQYLSSCRRLPSIAAAGRITGNIAHGCFITFDARMSAFGEEGRLVFDHPQIAVDHQRGS